MLQVLLEPKRLLVHRDASVAELAHSLVFSEPTNLIKFSAVWPGLPRSYFAGKEPSDSNSV